MKLEQRQLREDRIGRLGQLIAADPGIFPRAT
jgi:hypothetical protein